MTQFILDALPFLTFTAVGSLSPGPNNVMVAASGMNYGYRGTLPHILGVLIGFGALLILCLLGVGVVFTLYPALETVLKILSAAYLLYLAYRIATAGRVGLEKERTKRDRPLTFFEAAAFQFINPKAWVIGVAATAGFLPVENGIAYNIAIIILTLCTACAFSINTWTLFGKILARAFKQDKTRRAINIGLALMLVATIPMMLDLY